MPRGSNGRTVGFFEFYDSFMTPPPPYNAHPVLYFGGSSIPLQDFIIGGWEQKISGAKRCTCFPILNFALILPESPCFKQQGTIFVPNLPTAFHRPEIPHFRCFPHRAPLARPEAALPGGRGFFPVCVLPRTFAAGRLPSDLIPEDLENLRQPGHTGAR